MAAAARLHGLRVVFVLNWPVLGGSERQAFLLARHLAEVEGASVEVRALTDEEGRGSALFREAGIPWRGRPGVRWSRSRPRTIAALARVAAHLRRVRPDVLLPYCGPPNVVCGLVWRHARARTCVWNQRDTLPFAFPPALVRRAVRSTPVVVSNSRHAAEHLEGCWGVEPGRVRVIRNGIALPPPRHTRAWWRARLDATETDVVVTALAHLVDVKNHVTLLRAWDVACRRLRGRGVPGILVLAGRPGGMQDALEALARSLGVERNVRFPGDVDDVAGLLSASDVGVLSSTVEGCPNALLECMAAGLAVAGSDVEGIREAVGLGGAPFLAPAGDHEHLGAVLARLALDRELRTVAGARNGRRVEDEFGLERMLEESVALIAGALEQRPVGPRPPALRRGAT